MQLKLFQITSTWVHESGWMARLEGELFVVRLCIYFQSSLYTENDFSVLSLALLFKGTNGSHMEKQVLLGEQ